MKPCLQTPTKAHKPIKCYENSIPFVPTRHQKCNSLTAHNTDMKLPSISFPQLAKKEIKKKERQREINRERKRVRGREGRRGRKRKRERERLRARERGGERETDGQTDRVTEIKR